MTEKQIRKWIDRSENNPEIKAQILKILPTAYDNLKLTPEEQLQSFKQYASKKNTRPSRTTTDETEYHKMTELQIRTWIDRSKNKPEIKAQILEILPTAYERREREQIKLTLEDKFKSLKQYASKKNERPSRKDETKYHEMTEKQIRTWIDNSRNKPERKAQILEILPTAYGN